MTPHPLRFSPDIVRIFALHTLSCKRVGLLLHFESDIGDALNCILYALAHKVTDTLIEIAIWMLAKYIRQCLVCLFVQFEVCHDQNSGFQRFQNHCSLKAGALQCLRRGVKGDPMPLPLLWKRPLKRFSMDGKIFHLSSHQGDET